MGRWLHNRVHAFYERHEWLARSGADIWIAMALFGVIVALFLGPA